MGWFFMILFFSTFARSFWSHFGCCLHADLSWKMLSPLHRELSLSHFILSFACLRLKVELDSFGWRNRLSASRLPLSSLSHCFLTRGSHFYSHRRMSGTSFALVRCKCAWTKARTPGRGRCPEILDHLVHFLICLETAIGALLDCRWKFWASWAS